MVVAILFASIVGCATSAQPPGGVTVRALWYGKNADGSYAHGVTPVQIASTVGGGGGFSVDLSGLRAANTGEYWNASAWSAATYAALASEVDPRGLSISFNINEAIDGPSAGGLMALGATADLARRTVPADVSMTGTIFPGGGLGPVGGIADKVRAAAAAGITTVFIPAGSRVSVDLGTGQPVDVVDLGTSIGVRVVETASVQDAYRQVIGGDTEAQANVGGLDPELLAFLNTQTTLVRARLAKMAVTPAPTAATRAEYRQVVDAVAFGRAASKASLKAGDLVAAFAQASAAEYTAVIWNATATAITAAKRHPKVEAAALRAQAAALLAEGESALSASAGTGVAFLEQLTALPDALSWATDAINAVRTVQINLTTTTALGTVDVANAAAELAQARYDIEQFLPVSVRGLTLTGHTLITDPTDATSFLNAYADLLDQAADANNAYSRVADTSHTAASYDAAAAQAAAEQWERVKTADSEPAVAIKLSAATSSFVASTALVASLGVVADDAANPNGQGQIRIRDRRVFDQQSDLAVTTGNHQARQLAADNLDPTYTRWNNTWGRTIYTTPAGANINDQLRRDGLEYQWFATINAALLAALHATPAN